MHYPHSQIELKIRNERKGAEKRIKTSCSILQWSLPIPLVRSAGPSGQICAALCIRDWEQNGCTLLWLSGVNSCCARRFFLLYCFECAMASRGSAPLGGGFGKCEEKWACFCAETKLGQVGPVGNGGNDLVSKLTLTGQRTTSRSL